MSKRIHSCIFIECVCINIFKALSWIFSFVYSSMNSQESPILQIQTVSLTPLAIVHNPLITQGIGTC